MKMLGITDFGYADLNSLIDETLERWVIDLSRYAYGPPEYMAMLLDPPIGVYDISSVEPILNFAEETYVHQSGILVDSPEQFFNLPPGRLYTGYGAPVMEIFPRHISERLYRTTPCVHWAAMHCAFVECFNYAMQVARHVRPVCITEPWHINLECFVKPEALRRQAFYEQSPASLSFTHARVSMYEEDSLYISTPNLVFEELYEHLYSFIKHGKHNLYRFALENTTLVIEKGHDIRIIEYHRMMEQNLDDLYLQRARGHY